MAEQAISLDSRNANRGTERGEYMVEHSLRTYGAGRGPVVDKHNVVIAGNKTVAKAMELGIPIEIIESDGKTLYVIKRTDLDLATDPAAMELGLIDNRSAQVGIDLDPVVVLALQEAGADLSAMWYSGELLGEALEQTPTFSPVGLDEQGRLDEKAQATCPSCGHVFTP